MLVFADGRTVGTIGGGCYEHDAFWKAREALKTRKRRVVHYELNDDFAEETGLICGGQMDVFIEPIEPAPRLYLLGARPRRLSARRRSRRRSASGCTSSTTARSSPTPSASPPPTRSSSSPGRVGRPNAEIPACAFVVVLTRGHRQDLDVLRALAGREFRYVGLIGSRAKVARLTASLVDAGVSPTGCSGCTRPSASTSAPSRLKRSPSPSSAS